MRQGRAHRPALPATPLEPPLPPSSPPVPHLHRAPEGRKGAPSSKARSNSQQCSFEELRKKQLKQDYLGCLDHIFSTIQYHRPIFAVPKSLIFHSPKSPPLNSEFPIPTRQIPTRSLTWARRQRATSGGRLGPRGERGRGRAAFGRPRRLGPRQLGAWGRPPAGGELQPAGRGAGGEGQTVGAEGGRGLRKKGAGPQARDGVRKTGRGEEPKRKASSLAMSEDRGRVKTEEVPRL